jgi:RNA polymerase sigma-70 factor (ECF subfamily)
MEECVGQYGNLVWSLARRYCPVPSDAEDAVQEIFIELWRVAGRFDPSVAPEAAFVAMIARRRLTDRRRAAQRGPRQTEFPADLASGERAVDQQAATKVDAAAAREALAQLRPEQQHVLKLAIWHDLTHQEIADATGMPLGTVKTLVRRGLLQVREMLNAARSRAAGGWTQ